MGISGERSSSRISKLRRVQNIAASGVPRVVNSTPIWLYDVALPARFPSSSSRARDLGLDHGVGHFRSLSMTRQRHLLASHGIAMSHEGLCQVFLQLLSPQPIVFQQVTNTFSFNDLQEKQENQIVIQIVYFVMI